MNLFEEGGMKDDGLDRDPVSGNEIPPGSLAKEVRDDIPAQLSDGEYVVPADVVQYYGVKFFEDLRAEAKRGLAQMEATGRIGGEPLEVDMTMIAFGQADKKKKEKKFKGGAVGYTNGGVADEVSQIEKARTFSGSNYGVLGFTPDSPIYQTGQGQGQSQKNTTTMTYYHGQTGEAKVVTFVNGIVTPPSDLEFTQPPWSLNKPAPTQQQVSKDRDDKGSSNPSEELKKDGWGLDPEKYNFSTWNAERFIKEAADQLKISASERFITGAATLVNPIIGGIVGGMATGDGLVNTKVMINMLKGAGDNETASTLEDMYKEAVDNLSLIEKTVFTSGIGENILNGSVTLKTNNANESNSTFSNFVNDNSLVSSYSGSLQQNNIIKSPIKPTIKEKEKIDADKFMKNIDKEAAKTLQGENLRYSEEQDLMLDSARPKPTIATDFATDDKDPVSAEEENLSKAYGGGEASKKFGMKKGGLATRTRKRRNK